MSVKPQAEHHLEVLSLKGGCTGSSESSLVKISNCWKSHAAGLKFNLIHYYVVSLVYGSNFLHLLHVKEHARIQKVSPGEVQYQYS